MWRDGSDRSVVSAGRIEVIPNCCDPPAQRPEGERERLRERPRAKAFLTAGDNPGSASKVRMAAAATGVGAFGAPRGLEAAEGTPTAGT